ncbi:Carboxypeptidase A2-like protein [Leptotrombidium deliense]|uniref:Carboxypeptidase A2-like protein n=1 Tax=Leptotrombidium deliense TaxID=299467 RepID=A0A443SPE3_9ACAR|nr:Carboxypeptidase A2-like protein [Leptotrombidium deliense]
MKLIVLLMWFAIRFTVKCDLFHQKSYFNHKLYSIEIGDNRTTVELLNSMLDKMDIDFWQEPGFGKSSVNCRVSPQFQSSLEQHLKDNYLPFKIIIENIQEIIDKEKIENNQILRNSYLTGRHDLDDFRLDYYHTYEEINNFMESMERRYPKIAKVITIGETYEFHKIRAIKLGHNYNESKPVIWIDAGIHAREWIAPATAVYVIYKLAVKHEIDPEINKLLQTYNWYILPVVNPDGYMYSWWTNRLWRKNRALPKANPIRYPWKLFDECIGVDINRNFDISFGGSSTSGNPCSEIFRGDYAFSEKESKAIRDTMLSLGSNVKAFLTLHSYSQMWMYPYGYTTTNKARNVDQLHNITKKIIEAVKSKHGESYRYGPIATTIYPTSGSSPDWAHDFANITYSFIVELRDRGDNGFLLPRQYILPTAEEIWEGIKIVASEINSRKNS